MSNAQLAIVHCDSSAALRNDDVLQAGKASTKQHFPLTSSLSLMQCEVANFPVLRVVKAFSANRYIVPLFFQSLSM